MFMRHSTRRFIRSAAIVLLLLAGTQMSMAQDAPWQWKVDNYATVYPTKAAAEAFMRSIDASHALLQAEPGASSIDATSVQYRYSVPSQSLIPTAWRYRGPGDPIWANDPTHTLWSSEAEALQKQTELLQKPGCPASTITPNAGWVVTGTNAGFDISMSRSYSFTNYSSGCSPSQPVNGNFLAARDL